LTVDGRVYAAPGRELKILINPPLGHISPSKKEAIGQNIKFQGAGFAKKKWRIKLLVLNYRFVGILLQCQDVASERAWAL